jgi:hypothetical protein
MSNTILLGMVLDSIVSPLVLGGLLAASSPVRGADASCK